MCCSVSPGIPVQFSNTVLYAAEMLQENGDVVHVLGYQNKARNHAGIASPFGKLIGRLFAKATGNAMILPFPAMPRSMSKANVLNTKNSPNILQDMARALTTPPLSRSQTVSYAAAALPQAKVQVFEAAGIYTVVLAQDARDIPDALEQVPREKRPSLNAELFAAYSEWYPDWTIALCCFNNQKAALAHPMLWWYKPMFADRLFLPALDGHSGAVPDLRAEVMVDHTLAVASYQMTGGTRVRYSDDTGSLSSYLSHLVVGEKYERKMANGDFLCGIHDVRNGRYLPLRIPPTQLQDNLP